MSSFKIIVLTLILSLFIGKSVSADDFPWPPNIPDAPTDDPVDNGIPEIPFGGYVSWIGNDATFNCTLFCWWDFLGTHTDNIDMGDGTTHTTVAYEYAYCQDLDFSASCEDESHDSKKATFTNDENHNYDFGGNVINTGTWSTTYDTTTNH